MKPKPIDIYTLKCEMFYFTLNTTTKMEYDKPESCLLTRDYSNHVL